MATEAPDPRRSPSPVKVFISYTHEDKALKDRLLKHLASLKRQGVISEWHDRRIPAGGGDWAQEIDAQLESAQIVLLLVSSDFLASDYCYEKEMKRALEKQKNGETRVIPIFLRPCAWQGTPIERLQGLPSNGEPITSQRWSSLDEAFEVVTRGIHAAAEELHSVKPQLTPQANVDMFRVSSPQGPGDFPVSVAALHLLKFADLHKRKELLVSEMLLFATIELGRDEPADALLPLFSNAVGLSVGGWPQYEALAEPHFDRNKISTPVTLEPVHCTANFLAILRGAERIASLVASTGPQALIDVRHLLASLLLTKTVATSVMTRLGLELATLKKQLYSAISQASNLSDNFNVWSTVLFGPRPDIDMRFVPFRADFTADNIPVDPSANDRLGFGREVRAFASLIASRDLTPPMSIGIFGDWGSGKSFFMKQLEQKIVALAGKSKDYCSHVVPIWFNAWHYVDQNLWATLVTEIFDKLFACIRAEKEEDTVARITAIEKELSKQHGLHTEAQAELVRAKAERTAAENELKILRQQRKEKENSLSVQLNDVAKLVSERPEVKSELQKVERDLGLPALSSSYETFEAQVKQMESLGNRAVAVLTAAFREPGWIRRLGYLLVVFALPAASVLLLRRLSPDLRTPAQIFGGLTLFLASSAVWMRSVYIAGSRVIVQAENALAQLKVIRERRAAEQEAENIDEIEVLRERENAARQNLKEAESKIQELQHEVQELQPGRRLQRFIEQRSAAGDYRQHLGLISLIRRDFETLSRLLRERQDLPVDRIVLFIDDLDRCPPDRVAQVLEAIHLILAFELFVVVVGVDVRWIARSLQERYAGLLTADTPAAGPGKEGLASPDDYLEKIFQIPFWINPLQGPSSRELVSGMLERYRMIPPGQSGDAPSKSVDFPPPTGASSSAADPANGTNSVTTQLGDASAQSPAPGSAPGSPVQLQTPPAVRNSEELSIPITLTNGELDYLLQLSEYGGRSPRRLKRFLNIYRIIKSTVAETEASDFLIRSGEQGDYKFVLTLVAVLTGSPAISGEVLRKLQQPNITLTTVLEELKRQTGAEYKNCIDVLSRFQSEHQNIVSAALNRWATTVSRYNFRPQR